MNKHVWHERLITKHNIMMHAIRAELATVKEADKWDDILTDVQVRHETQFIRGTVVTTISNVSTRADEVHLSPTQTLGIRV